MTPTPEQLAAIRELAAAAGSRDELIRWIMAALPGRPGRPPGASRVRDLDEAILAAAEAATRISGLPLATTLRLGAMLRRPHGASLEADIDRLRRKARAGHKSPAHSSPSHS